MASPGLYSSPLSYDVLLLRGEGMLRVTDPQESLWWHLLPQEVRTLPEYLAFVDSLLDGERFFRPFRERFNTRVGRRRGYPPHPAPSPARGEGRKSWIGGSAGASPSPGMARSQGNEAHRIIKALGAGISRHSSALQDPD